MSKSKHKKVFLDSINFVIALIPFGFITTYFECLLENIHFSLSVIKNFVKKKDEFQSLK